VPHQSSEILSTLFSTDPPMQEWLEDVDMLVPSGRQTRTILAVLRRAQRYQALVLDGSSRRDQVAALLSLRPRRPAVIVADATWKSNTNLIDMTVNKVGIHVMDGFRTTFCVPSTFEVESFVRTWGQLRGQVRFVAWPYTLPEAELQKHANENGRVFAGGNSLRDHDAVIDAARLLPSVGVDLATGALNDAQMARLPMNVNGGAVPQAAYDEMMLNATVVVVALQARPDRSSGQTTYVNAMARGKALVVTDTPGVRDYLQDHETALIVPPRDPAAIACAVQRLLDDAQLRRELGARAREHAVSNLTLTHYARRLLAIVSETTER